MGFVKLFVSRQHVSEDMIEITYKRWLKADAVIGDPEALDILKSYHESVTR